MTSGIAALGRIVVGVDGSEGSHHAAAWAVEEAARRRATVELVHVWSPPMVVASMGAMVLPEDDAAFEEAARRLLQGVVDEVQGRADAAGVSLEQRTFEGHPTTALLERLDDADLLVLGSRGHTGLAGLLLGSVSNQCVHHADKPVAVVPVTAPVPSEGDVVVGVDGSEHSYLALRWAVGEAGLRRARLVVIHAWFTPIAAPPVGIAVSTQDREELEQDTVSMLHEMVDGMVEQADDKPAAVELIGTEEPPAQALLDRSKGAGLVVVGSRGRGGFAGLLLGSVSQRLIHHADSAVVVIR